MIVDTEAHILLFARRMYQGYRHMVKHYTWHEQPVELFLAEMDQAGVDKAFLISYDAEDVLWGSEQVGFSVEDFGGGRKYTLDAVERFPDRFWWFNTVKDPARYDSAARASEDFEAGAAGVKVFPAYIQSALTDPGLLRVFDVVAKRQGKVLISFEKLNPPASLNHETYMDQLDQVLSQFPSVPFALLHVGCVDPLNDDVNRVFDLVQKHENLFLSTAYPGEVWDDGVEYPFANYQARIKTVIDAVGSGRTMWGTDWPWFDDKFKYLQAVDAIKKHATYMTKAQIEEFLGGTAARFMEGKG